MAKLKKENKIGIVAAVCGCALLFGWFFYAVRFGLGRPDEAFYLSIVQRLANGERLLLDEWHLTQFTSFFLFLPYRLFTAVTGGTQGVILFMRCVYLGTLFLTYWYIVYKMRKRPIPAAVCAFLFCSFVPYAIFAVEYYSLPPILLLAVCFILTGENQRFFRGKLILCGVLVSCVVLMVPQLAVLYPVYTAVAAYHTFSKKEKKPLQAYDFVFDKKVWVFFSIGVAVSLALFLLYLTIADGWGNVARFLPMLFTDSEYNLSAGGNVSSFLQYKTGFAIALFHPLNLILLVAVLVAALVYRRSRARMKNPTYFKLAVLVAACVILIAACCISVVAQRSAPAVSFAYWFYHTCSPLPAFFFCLVCYILCENKDRRLFFFWWAGLLLSLFRDVFSDVSLGIGCILAVVPLVVFFPQVVKEIRTELSALPGKNHFVKAKKNAAVTRFFRVATVGTAAFFIIWNAWNAYAEGTHRLIETWGQGSADSRITSGPYKGIYTSADIRALQEKTLGDLDRIAELSDGPVYVTARLPEVYLYLDRPNPAYSSWFVEADIGTRQVEYWRMHPEKLPSVIYVPDYKTVYDPDQSAEQNFTAIEDKLEYESVRGEVGTIILVSGWKL